VRIRALKACPERSEGRRLGEDESPQGDLWRRSWSWGC